jgi:hypothetical protein
MTSLKNKLKATKCSDHSKNSLIAYTAKRVARILRRKTERKIEDVLGEDQFGFRRRTGDPTGILRIISEQTLDMD